MLVTLLYHRSNSCLSTILPSEEAGLSFWFDQNIDQNNLRFLTLSSPLNAPIILLISHQTTFRLPSRPSQEPHRPSATANVGALSSTAPLLLLCWLHQYSISSTFGLSTLSTSQHAGPCWCCAAQRQRVCTLQQQNSGTRSSPAVAISTHHAPAEAPSSTQQWSVVIRTTCSSQAQ